MAKKLFLIIAALIIAIAGGLVYLASTMQGICVIPGGDGCLGQASSGNISQNIPADWQTYRNEEYGFEFKYPKSYGTLENTPGPAPRSYGQFVSPVGIAYAEKIKPLLALHSTLEDNDGIPFAVFVFSSVKYGFVDVPGGVEYRYDAPADRWSEVKGGVVSGVFLPPEKETTVGKAYLFGSGDAGEGSIAYVIPRGEFMFEFGFRFDLPEDEIEKVLATIRFL